MIFIIIGIFLLTYSFINYKKSFLLFLGFKLFLNTNITLISIPGIPLLTLDMFLTIGYFCVFILKGKKLKCAAMPFPFTKVFWLIGTSYFLSAIFSIAGFGSELSNLVGSVFQQLLIIWIIWCVLETTSDFTALFKIITVIIFVSCIYGVFESLIQANPLISYEATLNKDLSKLIDYSYETSTRGYRTQSIFEHCIGAGINWSMYSVLCLKLFIDKKTIPLKRIVLVNIVLCLLCVILTKQRGPLIFLFISSLQLMEFKKKRFYLLVVLSVPLLVFALPYIEQYGAILFSIFDSSYAQSIGGSTVTMKIEQYYAAFQLMCQSPLFGFGYRFNKVMSGIYVNALRGMESVWISEMTRYGLFGLIGYFIYVIQSIVAIPVKFKLKPVFFFFLAYWVTYSLTSVPGMHTYCLFIIAFYYIKNSSLYTGYYLNGHRVQIYFENGKIKRKKVRGNNVI